MEDNGQNASTAGNASKLTGPTSNQSADVSYLLSKKWIFFISHNIARVKCPELDDPDYGNVKHTGFTPWSKAIHSCDPGFVLKGDRIRICQKNGKWSGEPPVCKSEFNSSTSYSSAAKWNLCIINLQISHFARNWRLTTASLSTLDSHLDLKQFICADVASNWWEIRSECARRTDTGQENHQSARVRD